MQGIFVIFDGKEHSLSLWKIKPNNAQSYSRQDLLKLNYPATILYGNYLVFHLQGSLRTELKDINDITKFKFYNEDNPLIITLAELMK